MATEALGRLSSWSPWLCFLLLTLLSLPSSPGDVEKAVTELIIDFDTNAEEEGPYEALYNAVSCHSLDSMASGRSSDRDSVNKETEAAGARTAGMRPVCCPRPEPSGGYACCFGALGRGGVRPPAHLHFRGLGPSCSAPLLWLCHVSLVQCGETVRITVRSNLGFPISL